MGAGQIGGIAALLDIDFQNAAGFLGNFPDLGEGQHVVHFYSQSMMFCVGSLIEAHVVLTAASCVFGQDYKFDVIGGTRTFLEHTGVMRQVHHLCLHTGYNFSSNKYSGCSTNNIALLVLNNQFEFNKREAGADFKMHRLRYGSEISNDNIFKDTTCRYYGWGSRRNGFLIPLLINIRKVQAVILPKEKCLQMFNYDDKYLCIQQHQCRDDVGSILECSGIARGMMTSRLMDRPCGVGFLDLSKYIKFLTCGVDDSHDVVGHDDGDIDLDSRQPHNTPQVVTMAETPEEKTQPTSFVT